ncbi:MAG: MMPL family transporter [Gorillibacterium sp.]|nr:MMPL family transporter [Gorillibacterium sp.]
MRMILKFKWAIMAVWVAALVMLMVTAPNMEQLVRDKGQITVPEGYSSSQATELTAEMNKDAGGEDLSTVLVFHSDNPLTAEQNDEIKSGIEKLKNGKDTYGVVGLTSHFDTPELAKQMLSEDGKTVLVLLSVSLDGRTMEEARDGLEGALADNSVDHYYTGGWLITEDVVQSSQNGLKQTEGITVAFILIILFVVFRSAVAPFIPLLAVGFSYLASQSIVAFLVDRFDFPLSTFSQIFLVAILFGIGTDYCILLISRFKEELAHGKEPDEAIITTYKTAGKTVIVSGIAVLVGFISIGFSTFSLYRSAVAVAVGVAMLLLALFTLVPFFLSVLGKGIFWPAKGLMEHKPSKLWETAGKFSLKRPLLALLLVAVVIVPFLTFYTGKQSFNSMDEIGNKYDSVKAFDIISQSFGPGEALPGSVLIKSDKPLNTTEGLANLEQIARELTKVEGIKTVRSVTRPTGEPLADLQVSSQVDQLGTGIGQGSQGLGQISQGLTDAGSALKENAPKIKAAASGATELVKGTADLKTGIVQLGDGLKQIEQGLKDGSVGAGELSEGLKQAQTSAQQLAGASSTLLGSYNQMQTGLGQITQGYSSVATKAGELAKGLGSVGEGLSGLALKYPELQKDPDFLQAQGALGQLQTGASQLSTCLTQLNTQLGGVTQGLTQANAGLKQASGGQAALATGLSKLGAGISELQKGITQAAAGQGQIITKVPDLTGGIDQLNEGQKQLQQGFADLGGQLDQLTSGLDQSASGLSEVTTGLESAQDYMKGLADSPDKQLTGWYVPQQALEQAEFQQVLDTYLSPDRTIAKFDIVFTGNPYEEETMDLIDPLKQAVERGIKGTDLANAEYAVGGISSMNHDLQAISSGDYTRTVIFMLIGISIILMLLFRSIIIPMYIIFSLLLTYYSSMAITEVIFARIFNYAGISWAVSFFGFVMLMALGVDYSIFLMDRFKEYPHLSERDAILEAMKNMGSVIMSAAIILGGTFAAMLPSGLMSIMQIATVVLSGLALYAFVILPLFFPVMVRTFGPANWWPLMNRNNKSL